MSWRDFILRIRALFSPRRMDEELQEELQFHLEMQERKNRVRESDPGEARRKARVQFGSVVRATEECREQRGIGLIETVTLDVRFAVRSLGRTPGLTAFVVLTLALGIGMTAGTFSMLDALVFRPYPVPHSSGVVTLVSTTHDDSYGEFSYREYLDIRDKTKSFEGVIANADMQAVSFSAAPGETPQVRGGMMVSANYFRVLGVEPRIGRGFREDEDQVPGRDAVLVLGPNFWRHKFASDPNVVGKTVKLNGVDFTIIGVAPESFSGMLIFGHPDFYMPLAMARLFSMHPQANFFEDRNDRELNVKARMKNGTTLQQAQNELAVLAKNLETEYPGTNLARSAAVHTQFEMRTRADDVNWKFGMIFVILAVAVLLVACTNVAGLLLSRARSRTREIAVRLAMGAGRYRLIRLLLTESLMLALLGGAGGAAVGYGIVAWFQSQANVVLMSDLPLSIPFHMDKRVLLVCLGTALLCALLCGLAPALQSTKADLVNGLKAADMDMPGRKRLWGRNALVVVQVAMSLMLLTASFLMVRGFQMNVDERTSFARDHLLMTSFDPRLVRYDAPQTKEFYKLLAERVRETPGVEGEALTQNVPLGQDGFDGLAFVPEGFEMPRNRDNFTALLDTVDPGYFQTMQIAILQGHDFLPSDTAGAPRVMIVNEQFARHYWPQGDALGKRVRLDSRDGAPVEIVGIARTIKYQNTFEKPMDFVYLPLAQHPVTQLTLMVRSNGDPLQLVQPVRDVVRSLNPNMPMLETRAYEDLYVNQAVKGPNIAIDLVGAMGLMGLMLAVAGLYGLVAYNVSRRTREIGIRMAIGATRPDVLRLVMGRGLTLVATGTGIGLVLGFAVERLMNAMLFNAGHIDLLVYLVLVPSLLAITALAAYLPARRACRIEPTRALRYE